MLHKNKESAGILWRFTIVGSGDVATDYVVADSSEEAFMKMGAKGVQPEAVVGMPEALCLTEDQLALFEG